MTSRRKHTSGIVTWLFYKLKVTCSLLLQWVTWEACVKSPSNLFLVQEKGRKIVSRQLASIVQSRRKVVRVRRGHAKRIQRSRIKQVPGPVLSEMFVRRNLLDRSWITWNYNFWGRENFCPGHELKQKPICMRGVGNSELQACPNYSELWSSAENIEIVPIDCNYTPYCCLCYILVGRVGWFVLATVVAC